jgi:hypothetical protein
MSKSRRCSYSPTVTTAQFCREKGWEVGDALVAKLKAAQEHTASVFHQGAASSYNQASDDAAIADAESVEISNWVCP